MSESKSSRESCQNCGTELTGLYCSACGQKSTDVLLSFRKFVSHALGEIVSIDARILHTLRYLFLKPGFLTLEYFAGRRARYIPPIKLYLSASFFLFFTLAYTATNWFIFKDTSASSPASDADIPPSVIVDTTATLFDSTGTLRLPSDTLLSVLQSAGMDSTGVIGDTNNPETETDDTDQEDEHPLLQRITGGLSRAMDPDSSFKSEVRELLPAMMFFLLPVFALLLKLLYVRRKRLYIQHFIFSLHFHAFAFLFIFVAILVNAVSSNRIDYIVDGTAQLGLLLYLFLSMHRAYGQSRRKTFVKLLLLLMHYSAAVGIALIVVFLVTLITF